MDHNTTLNAQINEAKAEIPSITKLATSAAYNTKINEVKSKTHSIISLSTNTALPAVKNKISNVSNFVKKN